MFKNKPFPMWLNALIALLLIISIRTLYRHYYGKTNYNWESFQNVAHVASKNLFKDTIEGKKWCDCIIVTFKNKYPQGLENVNHDTLYNQMAIISYQCIHSIRSSK